MSEYHVCVVGAGLAGAMLALMLGQRGFKVELFEKRTDSRISEDVEAEKVKHLGFSKDPTKRSINLALSHRGQSALAAVGALDTVMANVIPMPCRAIHSFAGEITQQPYGKPGEAIYSASRSLLNRTLLDACDKLPNVSVFFETSVKRIDAAGRLTVEHQGETRTIVPDLTVGADGAYSAVRTEMMRQSRMDYSRTYITHGYKELNMPPVDKGDGHGLRFAMDVPNALHIWPRKDFMMIALPNPDLTFTCTLFLPWDTLDRLDNDPSFARPFFEANFPDTLPLIPELEKQVAEHPSGALVMTKCSPWNMGEKVVILGDAAHSVVPFYGQGANAAFEDCLCLMETLDRCNGKLGDAVRTFAREREPAGKALADLSLNNYIEMRAKTASKGFLFRKQVEGLLQTLFPSLWIPQYSMVAFTRIPYDEVIRRAERQDRIIDRTVLGLKITGFLALLLSLRYADKKGLLGENGAAGASFVSRLVRLLTGTWIRAGVLSITN